MSFFKNVTKISTWTAGSRIGGFLREMLTAHFLGVGAIVDALVLALKIPSLIRRFTAEGTINSCFIPLFTSVYEKKGLKQAKLFAASVLSISVCILLTLSVLFALFTKPILLFLFPALLKTPDRMLYAIYFSRIMFPFVLFISITAVYGGVLNAIGRFTAFAASPFFGNLFIIGVVLVFLDLKDPTKVDIFSRGIVFAWAILFSGVVQLLVVLTDALRNDLFLPLLVPQKTPEIKSFFKRLGPSVMSSGIAQINIFVGLFIASWLPTGSISYLNYADRLVQLPLSVVGTAMGVALLPLLTKNLCQNKIQEANSYQETALAFSFLFSSFVFLAFVILSDFVVALVFKHGAFKSHDALATAKALAAYAWGLPAYIMIKILSARFFAKGQVKLPLIASAVSLLVDMVLSILLARVMGHVGIAIATSVAAWVNVLGLSLLLHKHKEWTWPRHLLFFIFKVTLLSFSLIVALGHFMQGHFSYVTTKIDAVFYTGTLGLFLLMLFGVGLRVACWAEIQKIISLIKKKQKI